LPGFGQPAYNARMTHASLDLIPDFDLTTRNTLALGSSSSLGYVATSAEAITALVAEARQRDLPLRILGGGSNVVLSDRFEGITGLVALKGHARVEETDTHVLVEAAGGEVWDDFVRWTVEQGLGGIENLAGIPGTVGAAPVQNIGAYDVEVADVFERLNALDTTDLSTVVFSRSDCRFAYRDSAFKQSPGRYIVLSVVLRLPKVWAPNLRFAGLSELDGADLTPAEVMERVLYLRGSKLPDWRVTPNAGSFFQNPIVPLEAAAPILAEFPDAPSFPQPDGRTKLSAGWLIERSGLKGFRMERAGISERHALVVINLGGARSADIAALAAHVKATVAARFGIALHEEPIYL
jgi:UDP-N-acetylmuramate dehydrogenase